MNRLHYLLFSCCLFSDALFAQEYKSLDFYEKQSINVQVFRFEQDVHIKRGRIDDSVANQVECLRILQAYWILEIKPEVTFDEFLSYQHIVDEDRKLKFEKWFYGDGKNNFFNSRYTELYSDYYIKGVLLFERDGKEYCYIQYSLSDEVAENAPMSVEYGIKVDGQWRYLNDSRRVADFGPLIPADVDVLKRAIDNGFSLFLNSKSGAFDVGTLDLK